MFRPYRPSPERAEEFGSGGVAGQQVQAAVVNGDRHGGVQGVQHPLETWADYCVRRLGFGCGLTSKAEQVISFGSRQLEGACQRGEDLA